MRLLLMTEAGATLDVTCAAALEHHSPSSSDGTFTFQSSDMTETTTQIAARQEIPCFLDGLMSLFCPHPQIDRLQFICPSMDHAASQR